MKLVMMVVDENYQDDVERILETHEVTGYTELPQVLGKGVSGRRLGSRAYPGSSTLYFTVVGAEASKALYADLVDLDAESGPDEGLTVFSLNAEMVV
jgi:hypothetical protein